MQEETQPSTASTKRAQGSMTGTEKERRHLTRDIHTYDNVAVSAKPTTIVDSI